MDKIELADRLDKIADMAEWKQSTDAIRQAAAALRESEELRRDAERYRFIAADHSLAWEAELDAAIDSARVVER